MLKSYNRKKPEVRLEFGKHLKNKRREQNLTLKDLAEKADLATSYLASIELGKIDLGLENIVAISDALNIAPK